MTHIRTQDFSRAPEHSKVRFLSLEELRSALRACRPAPVPPSDAGVVAGYFEKEQLHVSVPDTELIDSMRMWLPAHPTSARKEEYAQLVRQSGLHPPTAELSGQANAELAMLLPGRRKAKALAKERMAAELLGHGLKPKVVSRQLCLDVAVCYRINQQAARNRYSPQSTAPRQRRPVSPRLCTQIERYLAAQAPGTFHVAGLRRFLVCQLGDQCVPAYSELRRLARERYGLEYRRPQVSCDHYDDPQYSPERIWTSRTLASLLVRDACLVSIDESCFKRLLPARLWLPRSRVGDLPEETAAYAGRARNRGAGSGWALNVLGAITLDAVVGFWVIEGTTDSIVFGYFLEQVVAALRASPRAANKRIVLQIDNARPHRVQKMLESITALGVDVLFNARYSPQLNSIEMLW